MSKLLILDSNSILNRAYYGIRPLSTRDGVPTNAVYGFMNILMKLIGDFEPNYICAAYDLKAPTFRHKMYPEYKAQRHPMPEELARQLPISKELMEAMRIPVLEREGYEADDIIGTVSRLCGEKGIECLIATGDRDDLQLVSETTRVILTVSKYGSPETTVYDIDAVRERCGVTPEEFIDVKALMGDKSDNIPGVAGIGEKSAAELIGKFHSIEYIYENIDALGLKGKKLENLKNGRDAAFLSKALALIDKNVPIEADFGKCRFDGVSADNAELYRRLEALELKSVIKKLGLKAPAQAAESHGEDIFAGTSVREIRSAAELAEAVGSLSEYAFIPVFSGNALTAAAFADGKNAYYTSAGLSSEEILAALKPSLENPDVKKTVSGIKDAIVRLAGASELNGIDFDAEIAAYLIDPARKDFGIDALAESFLGVSFPERQGAQLSLLDAEPEGFETYAARALALAPLRDVLGARLRALGQERLYYDVELPLISVLADMQINGFLVDGQELKRFSEYLSDKLAAAEAVIYEMAGEEFNINSPKQLGVILYEKLGLKPVKKTKTGYSTNADALERIAGKHPIVGEITRYRQYAKLKSTYCDGLGALINPETHRIHSVFNQTVTLTGRISSSEPNMQNIPTRTELGRELRKMFAAQDGKILVDADYSQIELRVLSHLAADDAMINSFKSGEDIHAVTAARVFGVPLSEVTPTQRSRAKAVNFGIVYGIGEYSLSRDIGVSVKEAKAYIDSYLEKYHGVRDYMEKTKADAKRDGFVKTMMNRIRYIPELKSSNYNLRAFGERAAMNTPVQGSAADIIKLAMVRVYCRLKSEGLKSKLILQVHDELIVEAPEEEEAAVRRILREEMENAVSLRVPLTVDMSSGKSWYDAK